MRVLLEAQGEVRQLVAVRPGARAPLARLGEDAPVYSYMDAWYVISSLFWEAATATWHAPQHVGVQDAADLRDQQPGQGDEGPAREPVRGEGDEGPVAQEGEALGKGGGEGFCGAGVEEPTQHLVGCSEIRD